MGQVISIIDKLEKWTESYMTPTGDLRILTSNHGRIRFDMNCNAQIPVNLEFMESVRLLSQVSADLGKIIDSM